MSTKSRDAIYGGQIIGAKIRAGAKRHRRLSVKPIAPQPS
jgi:hypothetical protein